MEKYTITDFNRYFPDDDTCLEWLRRKLYPTKIYCVNCNKPTKHHRIQNRRVYGCDYCGHQISPAANTIFHHSPTPLRLWFYAIYLMSSTRCGISAKQLQRETGVTYKTAWRMFHQIRPTLSCKVHPSVGAFEIDETYIGGKRPGKRGRGAMGKTPIFGIAQRQGNVSAMATSDVRSSTVYPIIRGRALPRSMIYTDEFPVYDRLERQGYNHKRVHHLSGGVYILGNAHTNTIEGFWSLLKRGISGVYHAVSEKWLQNYLNEYSFRFNLRKDDKPMFVNFLNQITNNLSS